MLIPKKLPFFFLIYKREMHTNFSFFKIMQKCTSLLKILCKRHNTNPSNGAREITFLDSLVDSVRQANIVYIYNKIFHTLNQRDKYFILNISINVANTTEGRAI